MTTKEQLREEIAALEWAVACIDADTEEVLGRLLARLRAQLERMESPDCVRVELRVCCASDGRWGCDSSTDGEDVLHTGRHEEPGDSITDVIAYVRKPSATVETVEGETL